MKEENSKNPNPNGYRILETKGTSWNEFKRKIDSIILSNSDDEDKLYRIGHYIEEINMEGGIGETDYVEMWTKAGGLCWNCANVFNNCATEYKNQTTCKFNKPITR